MYDVKVVPDAALPDDQDWVFIQVDGRSRFCIKQSSIAAEAFAEGWAAARLMRTGERERRPCLHAV